MAGIKCPDPKWFLRLAQGKVTEEQERKLSNHIESCAACQTKLEELFDPSQLIGDTIRPSSQTRVGENSERLAKRLQSIKARPPQKPALQEKPTASVSKGYMDVMPWIGSGDQGMGRIHEFQLEEFLGRGGMGIVFRCLDTKLQRQVALKLMSPQLLIEPTASERFLREARSCARINHSNIVTVHAVNEINDLPYLVMELVDGESLDSRISYGQLPMDEVIRITSETASGLAAAHRHGVLHRDMKPGNIMLDRKTGNVKITDFGLATSLDNKKLTQTGLLVGTPEYVSPEQAIGGELDERSDLFSLGAVAYSMCSGQSPFASESVLSTLDKVRSEQPLSISKQTQILRTGLQALLTGFYRNNPKLDSRQPMIYSKPFENKK